MKYSDNQGLVRKVLAGDPEAQILFYERFNKDIRATVSNAVSENAYSYREDILEQCWIKLFDPTQKTLEKFDWRCSLSTWLKKLALNETRDYLRRNNCYRRKIVSLEQPRQKKGQAFTLLKTYPAPDPTPLQILLKKELRSAVKNAVNSLSPVLRTTIRLRFYKGYSCPEIARRKRICLATVYVRLARAYPLLRKRLSPYVEGAEKVPAIEGTKSKKYYERFCSGHSSYIIGRR